MTRSGRTFDGRPLVAGTAQAAAFVLDEPLSFWGGLDAGTGRIIDRRHPQHDAVVTGRILVLPSGRGSSSSSSVLAEALLRRTGPAGIVLRHADPIIVLGVLVADELYGAAIPVVVLAGPDYDQLEDGDALAIGSSGAVTRRVQQA
jgi:uncharacterized protein